MGFARGKTTLLIVRLGIQSAGSRAKPALRLDLSRTRIFYSQTKQKIPNKACSKDKQPDITFLRCRL
ncbi:hypothetical protein, partial [Neisseria mucosa]|uniref:hypothetical protein n=1 Tax=Neisseria mucosa TaxID=488 RepID=UPI0027DFD337